MLTHIVLFDVDTPDNAEEVVRRLTEMAPKIDVVESLEVGRDVIGSDRSWQIGLIVKLADRDALDTYATHPEHVAVLEFIRSVVVRSAAVDFIS